MSAEDELKLYEQSAIRGEKQRLTGEDPVSNRFSLKEFISRSAGRGRKRRRPRDVALVIDHDTGQATTLKDVPIHGLDVVAQSLLGHLFAPGEDPWPEFVRRLRGR